MSPRSQVGIIKPTAITPVTLRATFPIQLDVVMSTSISTSSATLASAMESDAVLTMLYHRASLAVDASIPLYTSGTATLRRALHPSPLPLTSTAPPTPFLRRRDTTSSLGMMSRRSSIRGAPSVAPARPLPSPYARYDRKYAEADVTHVRKAAKRLWGLSAHCWRNRQS
jgi:hypothetical protein